MSNESSEGGKCVHTQKLTRLYIAIFILSKFHPFAFTFGDE